MKHPIQPLVTDEHGTLRFKANAIVQYLLSAGPFDMIHLAKKGFSQEDEEQFAQLMGYSLSGFGELNYASNATCETAAKMSEAGRSEDQARIAYLEETLATVRAGLRQIVPNVFRVHVDDLVD